MKYIIIVLTAALSVLGIHSLRAEQISSDARISILTITPGEDLYSCFGHSALLVEDTTSRFFRLYNYGTFDFSDPNFYLNFTRGKLRYMLSAEDPRGIFYMAGEENRAVIQQVLNLSPSQKQRLFVFLENNALPENRFYKYDFFYDNCSSRLRDVLVYACGDSLKFHLKNPAEPQTFRGLIDPYLKDKRWQDLGMDLGMGIPADAVATPYQYMFLPDYLMNGLADATILVEGKQQKLVSSQEVILPNTPTETSTPFFLKPWFAFSLLFLLVFAITWNQYKKQVNGWWLDAILFGLTGLFGLVIILLWFATDHVVTPKNMNLLWAMPLHLIFIPMLLMRKRLKRVSSYFLAYFFVLFFLLIFWKFTPQELNANIIPFLMALALRAMYIYYRIDKDFVRWKS